MPFSAFIPTDNANSIMNIKDCIETANQSNYKDSILIAYKSACLADDLYCYTLDQVKTVIGYFFLKYQRYIKELHPKISTKKLTEIILNMPYIINRNGEVIDISPEEYEIMIDKYFSESLNCDYNIIHFFSGNIRLYRYMN